MIKIIYIPPAVIKIRKKNIKNLLKSFLYEIYILLKNFYLLRNSRVNNTSGYVEDAIYSNAYVFELPFNYAIFFSKILNYFFDGIFVNWKFDKYRNPENTELGLIKLSEKYKIKKVIVDSRDTSNLIIKEKILNNFNYVIKREKDKSINNKKYISSMLPCTLAKYRVSSKIEKISWDKIGKSKPNNNFKYDIFFSGKTTSYDRIKIIEFLSKQNLNVCKIKEGNRLPYNLYLKNIYDSSINLAPSGHGEFTYRHLEILASCSFMMCEKSINKIELPLPLQEGKHFVTYEDKFDLYEKIKFFLKNEKIRKSISLNGRYVLEKYYSPKKHGEMFLNKIF